MKKSAILLLLVLPLLVQAQVPTIDSFSPEHGPIGTEIRLSGSNFSATSSNVVFFGGVEAEVLTASATELIVKVPTGASYGIISVLANGYTGYTSKPYTTTFESPEVFSTSPRSFDTSISTSAEGGAFVIAPADFDNDGKLDVIMGNFDDEELSLYLNSSNGTGNIDFATPITQSLGHGAYEFAIADFNNDGKQDVVAGGTQASGGMVVVLENTIGGTNTFESRETQSFINEVNSVATGDFNQDGKIDLVYAGGSSMSTVTVMENTSSGIIDLSFVLNYTVGNTPYKVEVADMDLDGLPDIVSLNLDDNSFSVLKNTSAGGMISFDSKVDFPINSTTDSEWLTIGDINGDELPDIVVRNVTSVSIFENQSTSNVAFAMPVVLMANSNSGIISLDDFNGDTKPDLLVTSYLGLDVFANTSDGASISFDGSVSFGIPSSRNPSFAASADLDGDGEPDLITTSSDFFGGQYVEVLRNKHSSHDFIQFSFSSQTSAATINSINHTIVVEVTNIPDLTDLIASFETSYGVEVQVDGVTQVSGVTSNDFSSPLTFTLTAEDGEQQDWTINTILNCASHVISENVEVCGSYNFNEKKLVNSGFYTEVFTNKAGCDSTVTLDLTVTKSEFTYNIYSKDAYDFNGLILTSSGQYKDTLTRLTGCDSLITLNLTITSDTDPYQYLELQMPSGSPQIHADFTNLGGVIVSEDLDGDGDNDVVVSGQSNNTGEFPTSVGHETVIYWNNGDGNFSREENLLAALSGWVEIADFDRDGDMDVLLAGSSLSSFYVTTLLLNDGTGNFSPESSHGLPGFRAGSLEVVDLDQANGPDIVLQGITEDGDRIAKIYFNTGDGTFLEYTQSALTGLWGGKAKGGDIDGDGDMDLIMTGIDAGSSPQLLIYLNENDVYVNTITTGLELPVSHGREFLQFIDKNHDDALDLIVGTYFFINDGFGHFSLQTSDISSDISVLIAIDVGDVNSDGWEDLMISGRDHSTMPNEAITQLFLGDEAGNLTFSQEIEGVLAGTAHLEDINGDSKLDMLFSGYVNSSYTAEIEAFINDGTGTMIKNVLEPIDEEFAYGDARFNDFDGDGDQDLIIGGSNEHKEFKTHIYWNDGSGNFTKDGINNFAPTKYNVLLEDFNGDGEVDIITTHADGHHLYVGDGLGLFMEKVDANLDSNIEPFADVADIDGDTDMDLIIIGSTKSGIFRNNGSGVFTHESGPFINMFSSKVVFADVDGDSDQDVFIVGDPRTSGLSHQAIIYLNDGNGNFVEDIRNVFQGVSHPLASFTDVDGDGDLDLFYAGNYGLSQEGKLYFNDGFGLFTKDTSSEIVSAFFGESEFADLDGDGDMDLLITGHNQKDRTNHGSIYWNNGWGHFQLDSRNSLIGLNHSMLAVADTDGDGAKDIFISGTDNGRQTRLYRNSICQDQLEKLEVETDSSYLFYGETLTVSGTYMHADPLKCGKSRITTLELTILDLRSQETVDACESYTWNDSTYLVSGTYSALFTNESGFDSTAVLNLTILKASEHYDTIQVCDNYFWNDSIYTTSGDYSFELISSEGCDSIAFLNLSILESDTSIFEATAIDSYLWNDVLYETSGSYQQEFENRVGCDSTVILHLDIDSLPESDFIIGSSEAAHFESFESALKYLTNDHSFSTDVTFSVEVGIYNEGVDISGLNNGSFQVTFKGEEATAVIIQPGAFEMVGVLMEEVGDVVFANMTIDMGLISPSLVRFDQNENQSLSILHASDVLIDNIHLINTTFSDFRDDTKVPIATSIYLDDVANVTISNSEFGNTGTHLTINDFEDVALLDNHFDVAHRMIKIGQSGDELTRGLYIDNNQFDGKASVLSSGFKLKASAGNFISDVSFRNNVIAIEADSFSDDVFFTGENLSEVLFEDNDISFGFEGFDLNSVDEISFLSNNIDGTQNAIKVADYRSLTLNNNDIQVADQYALSLVDGVDLNLVHNSFYATEFSGYATTRIRILDGESKVQNNIFGCAEPSANHIGLNLIDIDADDLILDHNLYDANAQQPLVIGNLKLSGNRVFNSSDFSDWQITQQLFDQHSKSFQTSFGLSLVLESPKTYRFGQFIETVTIDLNGVVREEELGVDVGAYQHCGYYHNSMVETCNDSYVFHGETLGTSGTYEVVLTASNGCDSIASIDLTFLEPNLTEESVEACGGYIFGTQVLNQSGLYLETFSSMVGCDSVVSLNFNILPDPIAEIVQNDNSLTLANMETGVTYQWFNCETGEEVTGATESTFNPEIAGLYAVEVTNGVCTTMSDCLSYESPVTVLRTERPIDMDISIYPNPTTEVVHLSSEDPQVVVVLLITLDGKVLSRSEYEPLQEISFRLPKPGVFMVRVTEKETGESSIFRVSRIE